MQSYPYKFDPTAISQSIMTDANLFVYESGTTTVDGANTSVIVKPANGGEIVLKPGQRFRLPPGERAALWNIRLSDVSVTLQATFIVGSGEFDDANTLNKFKLDATFANTVKVTNSGAEAVPVALTSTRINNTTAQRVPVSLDASQVLNTSEGTVAYTKAWARRANMTPAVPFTIMTPAENVNGAYLSSFKNAGYVSNAFGNFTVVAKTSAPTNITDGDVLFLQVLTTTMQERPLDKQIFIPAGKGLYIIGDTAETSAVSMALLTIL